jgi:lactate 2-monooxygenase
LSENSRSRFPISFSQWEASAKQILKRGPFEFIHSGAGNNETYRANREAFFRWRIVPRVLRNVSNLDLSVSLFGSKLPVPILLAPVGRQKAMHPKGELATAKAAASAGLTLILSSGSSSSIEEVGAAMGKSNRWFQLYPPSDPEVMASILRRVRAFGYTAVVVTVDRGATNYPHYGRQKGFKTESGEIFMSDPVFIDKARQFNQNPMEYWRHIHSAPDFTWSNLKFIRKTTKLPVIIKGIVHPEDAKLALKFGLDGIVVSNHGGRRMDGMVATLDALPEIVSVVQGKIPIMFDSGIQNGVDVVKALALGAKAVLIGHLYAYGLAVGGEAGVRQVITNLISEFRAALAITGCSSPAELNASVINCLF